MEQLGENSTNGTLFEKTNSFSVREWILYVIIIFLFITALYVFLALTWYVVTRRCHDQVQDSYIHTNSTGHNQPNSDNSLERAQGNFKQMRVRTVRHVDRSVCCYKVAMLVMCVCSAFMCVAHFALEQASIFLPRQKISIVLVDKYVYGCFIVSGYAFYWVRQRVFYTDSSPLRYLHKNQFLMGCSTLSLFLVTVNAIAQLVMIWFWGTTLDQQYEAVSWLVGCTAVQLPLLLLFIYPLHKLDKKRKIAFGNNAESRITEPSDSVKALVRRSLLLAAVNFFSDFVTVVLRVTEANVVNIQLTMAAMLFSDVNCVVNAICLVGSFGIWRTMLFPWRSIQHNTRTRRIPDGVSA